MRILVIFLISISALACSNNVNQHPQLAEPVISVDEVLDDWHKAAAESDFDRYFGHFQDSTSIFMGTDATERWTVPEFKAYAEVPFEEKRGWNFTPFNRVVYYSANRAIAWFDEELDTPNLGLCRGSGVLVNDNGNWKIAHYNLALAIPNEVVYDVRDQIKAIEEGN